MMGWSEYNCSDSQAILWGWGYKSYATQYIFHLFEFYTHSKAILWGGDGVELPIVVETSDRTHLNETFISILANLVVVV